MFQDIEDRLAVLLQNDPVRLQLLSALYDSGVREPAVLASLAYLSSPGILAEPNDDKKQPDGKRLISVSAKESEPPVSVSEVYLASIKSLAQFLTNPATPRESKALALRLLLTTLMIPDTDTSKEAAPVADNVVNDALEFVIGSKDGKHNKDRESKLVPGSGDDATLYLNCRVFWEIRLACLQEQFVRKQQESEEKREKVRSRADQAAYWLWTKACKVESGLSTTTVYVTDQLLDPLGDWICHRLDPDEGEIDVEPETLEQGANEKAPVDEKPVDGKPVDGKTVDKKAVDKKAVDNKKPSRLVRTTNRARRCSELTLATANKTASGVHTVSKHGIYFVARTLKGVARRWVGNEDRRAVLSAAGNVALASIGAVVIVGDAVLESATQIATKSAYVTADVIEQKYGPSAAEAFRDLADIAANIVRTIQCIASFGGKHLAKSIAKDAGKAGKAHLEKKGEKFGSVEPVDAPLKDQKV